MKKPSTAVITLTTPQLSNLTRLPSKIEFQHEWWLKVLQENELVASKICGINGLLYANGKWSPHFEIKYLN